MTLREAIEKAKYELDTARRDRTQNKTSEIFAALDPDSESGNPNKDSVVNALAHDLYLALAEVETRRFLTVDVLARQYLATGIWIGRRVEQLMEGKHPNGQDGL